MATQKAIKTTATGSSAQADTPTAPVTYMAPGLMELRLMLRVGAAWIPVTFKGGRRGGYGDYQAIFTTSDAALQYMIEQSPEYKSQRISKVK